MTTLASAVAIGDNQLLVDTAFADGSFPGYVKIDDEILTVGGQDNLAGTTLVLSVPAAAVHDAGATVAYAGQPYNAAFLSATDTTVYRSERVTFDMEGLGSADNPPVPGIRLGDYVVPAGSFVLATVYVATEFDTTPSGGDLALFPLIRNTDGQTATALVDASIVQGSPGGSTSEGITSAVDPENSIITTEETHLGVGVRVVSPLIATLNEDLDNSETEIEVSGFEGLVDPPFLALIDSEIVNVTATDDSPPGEFVWLWTVQRGQEGTSAETHDLSASIYLGGVAELSVGEAYIVFWITPLSGDVP